MTKKKTTKKKTTTKRLPLYVDGLSKDKQAYVKGALTRFFKKEGIKGSFLKDVVSDGMDSKISDLPEFIKKKLKSK